MAHNCNIDLTEDNKSKPLDPQTRNENSKATTKP